MSVTLENKELTLKTQEFEIKEAEVRRLKKQLEEQRVNAKNRSSQYRMESLGS